MFCSVLFFSFCSVLFYSMILYDMTDMILFYVMLCCIPPNSKVGGSLLEKGNAPGWMGSTRI